MPLMREMRAADSTLTREYACVQCVDGVVVVLTESRVSFALPPEDA
jgi:hypothetical protein